MHSYYIYSLLTFITIIALIQIYYTKKKFGQQNIRIIDNYLQQKLITKILSTMMDNDMNRYYIIQNLIISYFCIHDIQLFQVKQGKILKDDTEFWSHDIELNELESNALIKLKEDQWVIYFDKKQIFLLLMLDKETLINKDEGKFLEKVILPLYAISCP